MDFILVQFGVVWRYLKVQFCVVDDFDCVIDDVFKFQVDVYIKGVCQFVQGCELKQCYLGVFDVGDFVCVYFCGCGQVVLRLVVLFVKGLNLCCKVSVVICFKYCVCEIWVC